MARADGKVPLDLAGRHGGEIKVESEPGSTSFHLFVAESDVKKAVRSSGNAGVKDAKS